MNRAPNDGLRWLHLLRFEDEADLGLEVVRDGRFFFVRYISEYGAAWRAGIRVGEKVSRYRLNIHSNEKIVWTEGTLAMLNAIPASTAIGIQVKISTEPSKPQTTRNKYINNKKQRKKDLDSGKVVMPNAPPFDFNKILEAWDKKNFRPPQGGAPAQDNAPTQGDTPAQGDDQDDLHMQSPLGSPAQFSANVPVQSPFGAPAQLSPTAPAQSPPDNDMSDSVEYVGGGEQDDDVISIHSNTTIQFEKPAATVTFKHAHEVQFDDLKSTYELRVKDLERVIAVFEKQMETVTERMRTTELRLEKQMETEKLRLEIAQLKADAKDRQIEAQNERIRELKMQIERIRQLIEINH